jgi:hypothetical protein
MMTTAVIALFVGVLTLSPSLTNTTTKLPPVPKPLPEPEPLRLKLTLTDGSQVIGIPATTMLPVKTSFAEMTVPFERIRNATFSKDHTEIVLVLSNGDRMTATPKVAEFQLATIFGKARIGSRDVAAFTVLPGGIGGAYPRDGLWGYWPLDGDAKDASGNGHDGIIRGAKPTEGVRGQAYAFDGQSTIEVGNPDFPNEEYTVAGWVRTEYPARREDWRTWIDKVADCVGPFSIGLGDGLEQSGKNGVQYIIWNYGNGGIDTAICTPQFNLRDGQRHHCVATYKKGSQKFFFDGVSAGETAYAGPFPVNALPAAIGGHYHGSYHHPWIGDIDEVFIYQRALTDDEVQVLYRHSQPSK